MELDQVLNSRRSVRNFLNKPVEAEKIAALITAGNLAPSACNKQAWKFIIVNKEDLKNKIFDNGGSIVLKNAPMGILVLYDNRTLGSDYQDHIQSAAAATENILLKAVDLGLSACWIGHLPKANKIREIFKIPKIFSPIAYIALGYPCQEPLKVERKYKISEIMNFNEFNQAWPQENINLVFLLIKKILKKIYYLSPTWLKKCFLNKFLDQNFVKKFEN